MGILLLCISLQCSVRKNTMKMIKNPVGWQNKLWDRSMVGWRGYRTWIESRNRNWLLFKWSNIIPFLEKGKLQCNAPRYYGIMSILQRQECDVMTCPIEVGRSVVGAPIFPAFPWWNSCFLHKVLHCPESMSFLTLQFPCSTLWSALSTSKGQLLPQIIS